MSAAGEAAAALGTEMAADLVQVMPLEGDDVLAVDLGVEAPVEVSSDESAAPEAPEVDFPDYEPELPEDLVEELEQPDFSAEAAVEVAQDVEDEYLDETAQNERRLRIEAEKKAKWLEQRYVQSNKSKWEAEAKKFFPLAEPMLGDIQADSRRAYLRQAKAQHEKLLPLVKPLLEEIKQARSQAVVEGRQQGRQAATEAWGTPTAGPGSAPVEASAKQSELESARKQGRPLSERIGVLMRQAGVDLRKG